MCDVVVRGSRLACLARLSGVVLTSWTGLGKSACKQSLSKMG